MAKKSLIIKEQRTPKFSTRAYTRCKRCGRPHGVIRRFGASIKHQRTGWNVNAMVAWIVERERVEEVGTKASEHDHVSHCYYRPSSAEDWPYELYTMVHARSNEECTKVIEELRAMTGLGDYLVLTSIRELKKCSPTYF